MLLQHQILLGFSQQHAIGHSSRSLIVEQCQKIALNKVCASPTNGFSVQKHTKTSEFIFREELCKKIPATPGQVITFTCKECDD